MILVIVAAVLVVLLLSLRAIAHFYTDYLWFQSVGASAAWQRRLGTQVVLAFVFALVFLVLVYINMEVAERLAPAAQTVGPPDDLIERYRELVEPRRRSVQLAVSLVFAIIAGLGASGQWQNWLLFRYGKSFGVTDPLHHTDVAFYIFKLPFLSYALDWAFAVMVIVLLIVAVLHYLNGGIRVPGTGPAVSGKVKAHLSLLVAAIALIKAADYWLDRYRLTLSNRGVVTGALYADVHAQLPATTLLIAISVFCAALFIVNIRQRGWGLPVIAVGLWALMAVMAGAAYPWFIHRFTVLPDQSARESKYIGYNIDATRSAMGIDKVKERNFDYETKPPDDSITRNKDTVKNIRVLDPNVVQPTFQALEAKLDFYGFDDIDVDRYKIDDETTQVLIGARELDPTKLPQTTWEAKHLSYTHGYGLALAPANAVTANGQPDFLVRDVPIAVDASHTTSLDLPHPEIYFGEHMDGTDGSGYAIVGTKLVEQGGTVTSKYQGNAGVAINSFVRKAAFALRFGDIEPLISNYLTNKSKILYNRDVAERVRSVAPFMKWDSDPYPVIAGGRLSYIVDGYTTAATYPYGQSANTKGLADGTDLKNEDFNYLRNSVKAVVDAYDGTVTMYLTDDLYGARDPIVRAYAAAFPSLFKPSSAIPAAIKEHLRYPEDMFRVQTAMWGRYHISKAADFYRNDDNWDVAQNPPSKPDARTDTSALTTVSTTDEINPYYLEMKLPQQEKSEFLVFRPFVPHSDNGSKRQLTSFMIGKSDPTDFGTLEVYTMTDDKGARNREVDGPLIAHQKMVSDVTASQQLTLLNGSNGGSKVDFGNMLIVPIDRGLLYVRPLYVRGDTTDSPPVLKKVLVEMGGQVQIGDTLAEALKKLFPSAEIDTREASKPPDSGTPTTTAPGGTTTPTTPTTGAKPADLIASAIKLFDEADKALRDGGAKSIATYQDKTAQAEDLIRQANAALGGAPDTTTTVPATSVPGTPNQ